MDEEILRLAAAPPSRDLVAELAARTSGAFERSREAYRAGEIRAAVNLGLAAAHRGEPAPVDHLVDLLPITEDMNAAIALLGAAGDRMTEAVLLSCQSGRNLPDRQGLYLHLAAGTLGEAEPPPELLVSIRQSSRNPQTPSSRVFLGLAARAVGDPDVLAVVGRMAEEAGSPAARRVGEGFLAALRRPVLDLLPAEPRPESYAGFTVKKDAPKVGRNDPCPCGSGKKHKRCCLSAEAADARPDPALPVGNRARHHRTMSERQFRALHPVEVLRIPPAELPTARLAWAMRWLARFRDFEAAGRFLDEYLRREDRETGDALNDLLAEMIGAAGSSRDADAVERFARHIADPEKHASQNDCVLALLREAPDRLERIERVARAALAEEEGDSAEFLSHQLLFFAPALGILVARGVVASGAVEHPLPLLDRIEWARDELLLPPGDPAGLAHDLLSEHEIERQLESEAMEANEKLAAEAEELRRALSGAKAREVLARRQLERQERKLRKAESAAERARAAAAELRGTEHDPERVEELRRKVESYRLTIAEGNEERRTLREELARLGAKATARQSERDRDAADAEADDEERDEEALAGAAGAAGAEGAEGAENAEGAAGVAGAAPDRLSLRIPEYSAEFRDAVHSVAPHVGRDAVATAGRLAAGDPAAWAHVKSIHAIAGLLSARLGRHRALFRLSGDDAILFERLIHRRDLPVTLRRLG